MKGHVFFRRPRTSIFLDCTISNCKDYGEQKDSLKKGDDDMILIKDKNDVKQKKNIRREELRKKLICETINENRVALEDLSKT